MSRKLYWMWLILISAALMSRLLMLNAMPLSPDEALRALPALDAARGEGWPAHAESPLLLMGNALLFLLFGAGDGIARLLPALAGSALVGLPFLWRRKLGETGALVAAMLLLVSPLMLFASRQVDSAVMGTLGASLILLVLFVHEPGQQHAGGVGQLAGALGGVGVVLGLTGGSAFYDVLLPGLVAWGAYRWTDSEHCSNAPALKFALLAGMGGAILLSSGLGFRWNGWLGAGDGLATWLAQWRGADVRAGPLLLLLYEPLAIVLVVFGLSHALKRVETFPLALTIWALLGILLIALRRGTAPTALVAALIPLTLLAGWGAQQITENLQGADRLGGTIHMALVFLLWTHAGLALARYTLGGEKQGLELLLVLLTVLIQALLMVGIAMFFEIQTAQFGVLLGSAVIVLIVQVGFAWGLAFLRPADPVEPAVVRATSPEIGRLRRTVDDLIILRGERPDSAEVALLVNETEMSAVLRWTFRNLSRLQVVQHWPEDFSGLVLTPGAMASSDLNVTEGWHGMAAAAVLHSIHSVESYSIECEGGMFPLCPSTVAWYLYRKPLIAPRIERAMLWTTQ